MKTLSEEVEYESPYIKVVNTSYEDKENNKKNYYWVKRDADQKAVVIAAVIMPERSASSKLVLIREFRVPLNDYEWGIPAGLIEKGETPEQAATRELKEETGLEIKEIFETSPPIYSSSGITNESVYTVFCSATGYTSSKNQENSEDIETFLLTKNEVSNLLKNPEIKIGAKAYFVMKLFINSPS